MLIPLSLKHIFTYIFNFYIDNSFSGQPTSSRPLKVKTEADTSFGSVRSTRTHVSANIPSYSGANQSFHGNQSQGSAYNQSNASFDGSGSSSKYGSHYTSLYANPTSHSSSSLSAASSRRLTVSGSSGGGGGGGGGSDMKTSGSYYGQSNGSSSSVRKNTASMYVTGSSNTIGATTGAEYLRQINANGGYSGHRG